MKFPLEPPSYRTDLSPTALGDLAAALAAYYPSHGGRRVTQAELMLTALLEDDSVRNGRLLSEGLYRIVVSPLIAL